jgi:hypothetical protein
MYLGMWGVAMATAAAGLWPVAAVALLIMGVLTFRHDLRRMRSKG